MESLVSIIVPIYNCEKYVFECLMSLKQQTYHNIEIICINDGSTDKSIDIIAKFLLDPRFKLINKTNGGLSSARNTGLDIAKGDYICFVDSDDFVDKNYVKVLLENIISHKCGIALCNFYILKNNNLICKKIKPKIYNAKKFYNKNQLDNTQKVIQCNKLFKREIFNNLRFPVGKLHEDGFVICEELYLAKKICVVSQPLYYYRQRGDSISHTNSIKEKADCFESLIHRMSFLINNKKSFIYLSNITLTLFDNGGFCKLDQNSPKFLYCYSTLCDLFKKSKINKHSYKLFCLDYQKYCIYVKRINKIKKYLNLSIIGSFFRKNKNLK